MNHTRSHLSAVSIKRPQTLSTGLIIRQDFRSSVRFVMFETGFEEFPYATSGGTAFIVNYQGRVYAVTCGHVVRDFEIDKLVITGERYPQKGAKLAPIGGLYFPSSPQDRATESDILDICIIEFKPEITPAFFSDPAYIIENNTVCTSFDGHQLMIFGCIKDQSEIVESHISPGFGLLEYQDNGVVQFDPLLRTAISKFDRPTFSRITGMSGAPVYDQTANALCGIVMRGNMTGNNSIIYFLDAFHILEMLKGVHQGNSVIYYTCEVWQRIKVM